MNQHLPNDVYMSEEPGGRAYATRDNIKGTDLKYYWAQIHLRIALNATHTLLYKEIGPDHTR